jgi:phosphopentomutase
MTPDVPIAAWEQAVIVVIFFLMILGLITGLRYLLNDQRKSQVSSQQQLLQQQQEFIEKRDTQWQVFLSLQTKNQETSRAEDRTRMTELTAAVTKLADIVAVITVDFRLHVAEEDAKFDLMLSEKQKTEVERIKKENIEDYAAREGDRRKGLTDRRKS